METERIALSQRERDRLKVLHEVQQEHWTQVEAARRLKLTDRHVRRVLIHIRQGGDGEIVHRLRWVCRRGAIPLHSGCEVLRGQAKSVKRLFGVTIIAVLTFFAAAGPALGSFAFFFIRAIGDFGRSRRKYA
jgi:hypothetical protein